MSLLQLFAEEVAGRSEGVASVRSDIAAEAALAWVGRLWRYSVLCGWTGEVVGRLARLGMYMRSLKTQVAPPVSVIIAHNLHLELDSAKKPNVVYIWGRPNRQRRNAVSTRNRGDGS